MVQELVSVGSWSETSDVVILGLVVSHTPPIKVSAGMSTSRLRATGPLCFGWSLCSSFQHRYHPFNPPSCLLLPVSLPSRLPLPLSFPSFGAEVHEREEEIPLVILVHLSPSLASLSLNVQRYGRIEEMPLVFEGVFLLV